MATTAGHEDKAGAHPAPAGTDAEVPAGDALMAPRALLQQLHQVQEELERYYLKCLDLDAERQLACVARDDAAREVQALRLQLQHLQRALAQARAPQASTSRLRGLIARVMPGRKGQGRNLDARRHRIDTLRASEWFDAEWYLARYPDVRTAGMDPAEHYDEFGWTEARNPGPKFDTAWYLQANPDVAAAGMNPLWHYLEHGSGEGRAPHAT